MYASMGSQCMRRWARNVCVDGLAVLKRILGVILVQAWRKYSSASRIRPVGTLHNWSPSRRNNGQGRRASCGCHGLNHPAEGRRATDPDWLS
jgi:hypothetical protein